MSDNTGGNVAYSATFNFNPSRGQHEQDVYFVRVSPTGGAYADADCIPNTDGNTHGHSYTYSNRYTKWYTYTYSEAHTDAEV